MERSECPICPDWVVKCAHFPEPVQIIGNGQPVDVLTLHRHQGHPFGAWFICINQGTVSEKPNDKGHLNGTCQHLSEFSYNSDKEASDDFDKWSERFLESRRIKLEDL